MYVGQTKIYFYISHIGNLSVIVKCPTDRVQENCSNLLLTIIYRFKCAVYILYLVSKYSQFSTMIYYLANILYERYKDFMEKNSDPRTQNWFLMPSPIPTVIITFCYLIFTLKIGPDLMKNRKAFQLNKVMIVYNAFQTIFSAWLFYEASSAAWMTTYSLRCQLSDYSINPVTDTMTRVSWWFFLSKFLDFTDTIFFVLRKKDGQVTVLHVIHHGIVPIMTWLGVRLYPEGHYTFAGYLNSFVHIIMYGYYMLSAMGPGVKKYLWWKKYLTTIQLIQFVCVMIHTVHTIFSDCKVPKGFTSLILFQAILFYILFMNFFRNQYTNPIEPPEKTKERNIFDEIQGKIQRESDNLSVQINQLIHRTQKNNRT